MKCSANFNLTLTIPSPSFIFSANTPLSIQPLALPLPYLLNLAVLTRNHNNLGLPLHGYQLRLSPFLIQNKLERTDRICHMASLIQQMINVLKHNFYDFLIPGFSLETVLYKTQIICYNLQTLGQSVVDGFGLFLL